MCPTKNQSIAMKISNQSQVRLLLCSYLILLLIDIAFLKFGSLVITINPSALYSVFAIVALFLIWRISLLKTFVLETTEHIFSIKYGHPLSGDLKQVIEVPLQKILFLKTDKGIINSFLIVSINSKKGMKNFYFRMGILNQKQTEALKAISKLGSIAEVDLSTVNY